MIDDLVITINAWRGEYPRSDNCDWTWDGLIRVDIALCMHTNWLMRFTFASMDRSRSHHHMLALDPYLSTPCDVPNETTWQLALCFLHYVVLLHRRFIVAISPYHSCRGSTRISGFSPSLQIENTQFSLIAIEYLDRNPIVSHVELFDTYSMTHPNLNGNLENLIRDHDYASSSMHLLFFLQ